jgi:hypothetical protein
MRPDARPQVRKNRRRIRWNTLRTFQGRERRRWLRIGRRSRTVYVGQVPNSANRIIFMAGLVHRRLSRVVRGWRLIDLSLRAAFPIPHFVFKGSLVDPRLRASNEHILIVRVPRAGGRPGYPSHPSEAARCASTEDRQPPPPPLAS